MISFSTIITLAFIAVRLMLALREGARAQSGSFGAWAIFVWAFLVPVAGVLAVSIFLGNLWAIAPVAAVAILAFPWAIARSILIPLGQPRLAYWLAFTSDVAFHRDRRGGAAIAAAWAISRQAEIDEADAAWLEARLAADDPLRGAGVVATALLLDARGDRRGARVLLETLGDVDDRACPREAKRLANAWLASEAAERGAWARVAELGTTLDQGGRLAWLLSGIAQSLLLEPMAPGKPGLWLRWALAPHRRATRALVERAAEALDGGFIEPEDEPPVASVIDAGADAFGSALSMHAALLSRPAGAVRPEDVRSLGHAWDAALDDAGMERRLLERGLAIGATGAAAALARVRTSVEDDLAAVVHDAGIPLADLGDKGTTSGRVRARIRDRLLAEIEEASDALRRRVDAQREVPAADEWREWANLVARYAHGVARGGRELRQLAFAKVYPDACSLAVWLYNERKERPLGNAIFRWLLAEATALDDQRAIALQTKNVACGV